MLRHQTKNREQRLIEQTHGVLTFTSGEASRCSYRMEENIATDCTDAHQALRP